MSELLNTKFKVVLELEITAQDFDPEESLSPNILKPQHKLFHALLKNPEVLDRYLERRIIKELSIDTIDCSPQVSDRFSDSLTENVEILEPVIASLSEDDAHIFRLEQRTGKFDDYAGCLHTVTSSFNMRINDLIIKEMDES